VCATSLRTKLKSNAALIPRSGKDARSWGRVYTLNLQHVSHGFQFDLEVAVNHQTFLKTVWWRYSQLGRRLLPRQDLTPLSASRQMIVVSHQDVAMDLVPKRFSRTLGESGLGRVRTHENRIRAVYLAIGLDRQPRIKPIAVGSEV
jgi:hypothetical protein